MNTTLLIILGVVAGFSLLVWVGTKILPKPLSPAADESPEIDSIDNVIPVPEGLPKPVDRFYRTVYGDRVPLIESFVITGRGNLRFKGVTLPARLRFIHEAGKGFRRYIETTFWGFPIMRVNEYFLDFRSRLALPFGVVEDEPQADEAANLGMWSETMMFPGVYLSTTGVSWEEVGEHTARLIVPFKDQENAFTVFFNEKSGLIDKMEALRWKNPGDPEKTRWQAQVKEWGNVLGWQMPILFAVQWMDEATPWLVARVEDVAWNVDISEQMTVEGS